MSARMSSRVMTTTFGRPDGRGGVRDFGLAADRFSPSFWPVALLKTVKRMSAAPVHDSRSALGPLRAR